MTDRQKLILGALENGPLNLMEVATHVNSSPFNVRAELRALKRERYVRSYFTTTPPAAHVWELSHRGRIVLWNAAQLELR